MLYFFYKFINVINPMTKSLDAFLRLQDTFGKKCHGGLYKLVNISFVSMPAWTYLKASFSSSSVSTPAIFRAIICRNSLNSIWPVPSWSTVDTIFSNSVSERKTAVQCSQQKISRKTMILWDSVESFLKIKMPWHQGLRHVSGMGVCVGGGGRGQ